MKPKRRLVYLLTLFILIVPIAITAAVAGTRISEVMASALVSAARGTPPPAAPTFAVTASSNIAQGAYHPVSWAELVAFLASDHTNWNQYIPGKYTCLEFSMDLVANAHKLGIQAWIVTVDFKNGGLGHAFTAFATTDRGVVYIEPQADDTYPIVAVGHPLCDAWGVYQCIGTVSSIQFVQCATAQACTKFTP